MGKHCHIWNLHEGVKANRTERRATFPTLPQDSLPRSSALLICSIFIFAPAAVALALMRLIKLNYNGRSPTASVLADADNIRLLTSNKMAVAPSGWVNR